MKNRPFRIQWPKTCRILLLFSLRSVVYKKKWCLERQLHKSLRQFQALKMRRRWIISLNKFHARLCQQLYDPINRKITLCPRASLVWRREWRPKRNRWWNVLTKAEPQSDRWGLRQQHSLELYLFCRRIVLTSLSTSREFVDLSYDEQHSVLYIYIGWQLLACRRILRDVGLPYHTLLTSPIFLHFVFKNGGSSSGPGVSDISLIVENAEFRRESVCSSVVGDFSTTISSYKAYGIIPRWVSDGSLRQCYAGSYAISSYLHNTATAIRR